MDEHMPVYFPVLKQLYDQKPIEEREHQKNENQTNDFSDALYDKLYNELVSLNILKESVTISYGAVFLWFNHFVGLRKEDSLEVLRRWYEEGKVELIKFGRVKIFFNSEKASF